MATIYPTGGYAYNLNSVVTTANSNVITPSPSGNIAAGGYVPMITTNGYTCNTVTGATTYNPITASVTYGSSMDTQLIDALFLLKPKLRKKYKGDREKFRYDMLAAARAQEQAKAVKKLSDLLGIEA